MVDRPDVYVVTCEHGGNRVPSRYAPWFEGWQARLGSHRGWDAGALRMAQDLSRALEAPLVAARVTRLLVDLNRSLGHATVHSDAVRRHASADEIARIVRAHYLPYRRRVEALVGAAIDRRQRVIHLSSHSFTPRLHGEVRRADIGLLYDPRRPGEKELSGRWAGALVRRDPGLRVRRNYPYAGKNDGLTTHLRKLYSPREYVGIEIEMNQAIVLGPGRAFTELRATVLAALRDAAGPARAKGLPV